MNLFFGQVVETALTGNGGAANASATGGAIAGGEINSGSNAGNAISIGDSVGQVAVGGGTIGNALNLNLGVDGGTAIADATGGNYNVAFVS